MSDIDLDSTVAQRLLDAFLVDNQELELLNARLSAFNLFSVLRIERVENLGDDADTTGAVCGQLGGACWGESGIPEEWLEGLARNDMIEQPLRGLLTK